MDYRPDKTTEQSNFSQPSTLTPSIPTTSTVDAQVSFWNTINIQK